MATLTIRKYLQIFVFTIGFSLGLICTVTGLVDPFGYRPTAFFSIDQAALSEHSHDRLYRLARFRNAPKSIIVLGDSRSKNLREEYFKELGVDAANLAYGGGTLYESINTFWFANKIHRPTHVILGLPFNLWTEDNNADRVTEAITRTTTSSESHYAIFGGI
jgi:hypothetical protein